MRAPLVRLKTPHVGAAARFARRVCWPEKCIATGEVRSWAEQLLRTRVAVLWWHLPLATGAMAMWHGSFTTMKIRATFPCIISRPGAEKASSSAAHGGWIDVGDRVQSVGETR